MLEQATVALNGFLREVPEPVRWSTPLKSVSLEQLIDLYEQVRASVGLIDVAKEIVDYVGNRLEINKAQSLRDDIVNFFSEIGITSIIGAGEAIGNLGSARVKDIIDTLGRIVDATSLVEISVYLQNWLVNLANWARDGRSTNLLPSLDDLARKLESQSDPGSPPRIEILTRNLEVSPGKEIQLADIFKVWDPDDDLKTIRIWDSRKGSDGGRVVLGTNSLEGKYMDVSIYDWSNVIYRAGSRPGSNEIGIDAIDVRGNQTYEYVEIVVSGTSTATDAGDTLHGTPWNDILDGLGGNDRLFGYDGDDRLSGGSGADELWAGAGDDEVYGDAGDDLAGGGPGNDVMWGGAGNDTLIGFGGDDGLYGEDGNDALWGGPGNDTAEGGIGNDRIGGGPGVDTLSGGAGNDELWGGVDGDTLDGGAGDDRLWAMDGDDEVEGGEGIDTVGGGPGNDTVRGGGGDDFLWTGPGDDRAWGRKGTTSCGAILGMTSWTGVPETTAWAVGPVVTC